MDYLNTADFTGERFLSNDFEGTIYRTEDSAEKFDTGAYVVMMRLYLWFRRVVLKPHSCRNRAKYLKFSFSYFFEIRKHSLYCIQRN
jgi:hypothetical protein